MHGTRRRKPVLAAAGLGLICGMFVAARPGHGAKWHVASAPVRYTLSLSGRPTHPSAGYFTHLPDGGILPAPCPLTHVMTPGGKEIPSYVLWHNRAGGLGLVFEDPGPARQVYVYVRGANKLRTWSPRTGLTPSAILCADPTAGTVAAARKLAGMGPVGPTVHYRNHAGNERAPLCIEGDLTGRPRPCSFYLLAYLVTTDPGRTWIAPFYRSGECEMSIDGQPVTPRKRIDKWGGTGQYVQLSEGLHRLEAFLGCPGPGGFAGRAGGPMFLTWRTPNATMPELGGERSDKVPMTGTSRLETRLLRSSEIARSGGCSLDVIESRDNAPIARVRLRATHNFWFEGESPMLIYELSAIKGNNPANTKYVWTFDGGVEAVGDTVTWFFPGHRENVVTLTAVAGERQSRGVHPFFGFTTGRTSINSADTRLAYRKASLEMFEACAARHDPTAALGRSYWNNLFRTLELGKGYPLLAHLLTVRGDILKNSVSAEQTALMQDILLDFAPRLSAEDARDWARQFYADTRDSNRAGQLKIVEAEISMHYLNDTNTARRVLAPLARGTGETAEWARIRLGDLAFISGDLNQATRYYGDVQNRVRHHENIEDRRKPPPATGSTKRPPAGRLARSKEELKKTQRRISTPSRASRATPHGAAGPVQNWKLSAVLDVSASETTQELIEQGFLLEAKHALRDWERDFPLSKISGDYILQESRFYIKLKDWRRARSMLEAYCEQVDASSFLPQATAALLDCMVNMRVPTQEIRAYGEKMKKRLQFHPAAEEFNKFFE